MSILIPNVGEVDALQRYLGRTVTLKLYSNNKIPVEGDTVSSYTEVTGGGYASKSLIFSGWTITPGDPTFAIYAVQDWNFTGTTGAPGTIYGYFIVDGSILLWAERFSEASLPFSPVNGSLVRITPRLEAT